MSMQSKLEEKLRSAFAPDELQVINESHLHAGHHHVESGHHGAFDGTGETHFRIKIVSQAFNGKSRIDRHRAINALLADEMKGSIHALAIEATAPMDK
jgi:BolA family transcriptional regulator, general stress-responsive regulator